MGVVAVGVAVGVGMQVMPGIAMCQNEDCQAKRQCYRYTAKPSYWQAYHDFKLSPGATMCGDFWANGKKAEDKR